MQEPTVLGYDDSPERTFTTGQTASVLLIGVISGVVPALQPLLLGQLASEAKISLAGIGQAAMLEALGMLLAASLAAAFLKTERLKLIAVTAIFTATLVNIVTPQLSGAGLIAARFVAGLSAGVLLWLWIAMLTRVRVSSRLIAIYVTLQAAALLALSSVFTAVLLPWHGAEGGYGAIAGLNGFLALLVPFVPRRYNPLEGAIGIALPSGRGLLGLVAVFLHLAAIMGLWVYIVPLAEQAGLSDETARFAISFALGAQIVAGIVAAVVAPRLNAVVALIGCVTVSILAICVLATAATDIVFIANVAVIAFLWMFAPPFQMPYLIAIDPSRKAAMQILSAQLLGVAAGPAIASFAVSRSDVGGALAVSIGLFAVAGIMVVVSIMGSRSRLGAESLSGIS